MNLTKFPVNIFCFSKQITVPEYVLFIPDKDMVLIEVHIGWVFSYARANHSLKVSIIAGTTDSPFAELYVHL